MDFSLSGTWVEMLMVISVWCTLLVLGIKGLEVSMVKEFGVVMAGFRSNGFWVVYRVFWN